MKLSEIENIDALVLPLVRLGYIPVVDGDLLPSAPHYSWIDWHCPVCHTTQRGLSIWPAVDFDGEITFDDVGVSAITHNGLIDHWQVIESFAGTSTPIRKPEEIELDHLGDYLAEVAARWGASKR